jgi:hypothetical protein
MLLFFFSLVWLFSTLTMVICLDDIVWIVVHHFFDCLGTAASCIWYTRNADMPISFIWDVSASFQKDLWQIFNKLTTIGVTSGYGFAYPFRTHEITTVVLDVRAAQSLDLGAVFCRSLFALLSFFVLSFVLHVLLRITLLVTPLLISHLKVVSSNHDHGEGPLEKNIIW